MLRARDLRVPAERRHRGDRMVAAVLVVLLAGAALLYGVQSPAAHTESVPATTAATPPPPVGPVPAAFTEQWQAASPATPVPLAAGDDVVVAGDSRVSGRDAVTGAERWSYTRDDRPLCTTGIADGRVLALYRNDEYCSELSTLDPETGARGPNRTLDARPGTRLIGQDPVLATGQDYVETFRSDLVRTAEYGTVRTLEEPGDQPRAGCTFLSFAAAPDRAGVLERCPGGGSERLTVIRPSETDGDRPGFDSSAEIGTDGAQLIAVSADRAAVLLPDEARLALYDRDGRRVGEFPVAVGPQISVPADGVARTSADEDRRYWWTGGATVALDGGSLQPVWSVPGTLGAGTRYGDRLLVPVPGGLADVDPGTGAVARTVPVDRDDRTGPVQLTTQGGLLVEQRGEEVVVLGPAGA